MKAVFTYGSNKYLWLSVAAENRNGLAAWRKKSEAVKRKRNQSQIEEGSTTPGGLKRHFCYGVKPCSTS